MTDQFSFDPDATGVPNGNYFGFEFTPQNAALVLLSAPWDVTVSYRAGSSSAPRAIIDASTQVEIHDEAFDASLWMRGISTLTDDPQIAERGIEVRKQACRVIEHIENGGSEHDQEVALDLSEVNDACQWLNDTIYNRAKDELRQGRVVGLVGGDHSTPLGLIRALADQHDSFGVLHVDAHADLRDAYEGFEFSHASIMRNVLKFTQIERLVQVAIRDFSHGEAQFAASCGSRVVQFSDRTLCGNEFKGMTWDDQCEAIIAQLPDKVYVSFDVDGLTRELCPTTGTPVPGGLPWSKAVYLIEKLAQSGRVIVGFDLNEVAPAGEDEWDAIVGARMLYKLSLATLHTN